MKTEKIDAKTLTSAIVAVLTGLGTADILTDHVKDVVDFNASPIRTVTQFMAFVAMASGITGANTCLGYFMGNCFYDTYTDIKDLLVKINTVDDEKVVLNTSSSIEKGA